MKAFIIAFALIAAVAAAGRQSYGGPESDALVVRNDADVRPDGYQFIFETSNGISAEESAQLKNAGREDETIEVHGSNSYTAPDGTPVQITFVANENGYQPQGSHLPTPPPPQPIPEYIQRSLDWIAAHPSQESSQQQYQPQQQFQPQQFQRQNQFGFRG